jgi:hypothetical protein
MAGLWNLVSGIFGGGGDAPAPAPAPAPVSELDPEEVRAAPPTGHVERERGPRSLAAAAAHRHPLFRTPTPQSRPHTS